MTRPELEQLLVDLKRKADKRRDEPGFAANVQALDVRIAEIKALLVVPDPVEPEPPAEPEPEPDGGEDPGELPVPVGEDG